ncbi:septum formation initiator family protein [Kitasatospora sp. NPDC001175]|uniref:septum formation initiator family protein n=1 Tax=Kitasatospora sp. NPDC001175 TaxID=3157103 RepID=UPI003D080EBC
MLPGQGGKARITVRPGRRPVRGRTPFAVLLVVLLSGGLLGLLMLNTALNEGSFELSRLQKQTTEQTDQQQTLQQQIDQASAPDALERRARELGMVPGGDPAFLQDDGKVLGKSGQAQDSPPVKRSGTELWQQQNRTAQPSASASASASPSPSPSPSPVGDGTVQIDPAPPATPSSPAGGSPR